MFFNLPDHFLSDIAATIGFGFAAIFLVVAGYKIFDWLTPKLPFDELLKNGNIALAIVVGSFILGICHVMAKVVAAIVGA